jgi:hypothetical protein
MWVVDFTYATLVTSFRPPKFSHRMVISGLLWFASIVSKWTCRQNANHRLLFAIWRHISIRRLIHVAGWWSWYITDVSVDKANPQDVKMHLELKIVILATLLFWERLQPFSSGLSHPARTSIRDITHGVAVTRLLACRVHFHDFCITIHWDQVVIFFHRPLIYIIFLDWQTLDDIGIKYDSVFSVTPCQWCLQCCFKTFFCATAPPPLLGQGPLIHEVSRSHTTTHHSR